MLNPGLDKCGRLTHCVNTEGSHDCECDAGYEYDQGDYKALICKDIDECVTGRVSENFF